MRLDSSGPKVNTDVFQGLHPDKIVAVLAAEILIRPTELSFEMELV